MVKDICSRCGQEVKNTRAEVLNKHKLMMLKIAAQHVIDTGVNDFALSELAGDVNNYTNWQKLRYHGLVHHVRENGLIQSGRWLVTRNGWAFLRGEIKLHPKVLVKNNKIVGKEGRPIHVTDVYRGSEAITTAFEYFDDNNQPIGWRPSQSAKPVPDNATLDLGDLNAMADKRASERYHFNRDMPA